MEPKFKIKDFKNLYRFLYVLEKEKGKILSKDYTFSSLDNFIRGFFAAAMPDQLEYDTAPNFIYFDKWLIGHLNEDVDTALNWSTLIQKRNTNNDEKAFEEFFHFLRIFKTSKFTTRTLIVDPVSRSYSINRWVEKYGHSQPDVTIYEDLHKIRWTQMSNSTSIWIDFLDISNNAIDGEWYLNEHKANEALLEEFGHLTNEWFNENISSN
jgi:hypothetical protein